MNESSYFFATDRWWCRCSSLTSNVVRATVSLRRPLCYTPAWDHQWKRYHLSKPACNTDRPRAKTSISYHFSVSSLSASLISSPLHRGCFSRFCKGLSVLCCIFSHRLYESSAMKATGAEGENTKLFTFFVNSSERSYPFSWFSFFVGFVVVCSINLFEIRTKCATTSRTNI